MFRFFFSFTFARGQWVWIKPQKNSEFATPIGCQIIKFDRGKALVRFNEKEECWIKPDQIIKSMHITSVYGVEDMISLGDINECAILRNLRIRYDNKQIYVSRFENCVIITFISFCDILNFIHKMRFFLLYTSHRHILEQRLLQSIHTKIYTFIQ